MDSFKLYLFFFIKWNEILIPTYFNETLIMKIGYMGAIDLTIWSGEVLFMTQELL